tara:strand:+ start:3137 stop:3814 length:678 start_codon:yes stop_codon:yes gene_type:complete
MRIIFVRHGESEGNVHNKMQGRKDYPLSEKGIEQAEKLKVRLSNNGIAITHLYSSPLSRALQTAKILSELWGHQIVIEPGLQEYDMGILSGISKDKISTSVPEASKYLKHSGDEYFDKIARGNTLRIETILEARIRARETISKLYKKHTKSDILLCVSHGGIIQRFIEEILETEKFWRIDIKNTALFDFDIESFFDGAQKQEGQLGQTSVSKINLFNCYAHLFGD